MTTKPTNPKDIVGSDKMPLHLWPTTATALGSLALLDGCLKYGRTNYRAVGVRASIYYDAAMRHLSAWFEGEDCDPDSGLPHLGHALACLGILVDASAAGKLTDDRNIAGGYRSMLSALTPEVARLKTLHAGKAPKHYTIADSEPPGPGPVVETIEPLPMIERRSSPRPEDADLMLEAAKVINDFGVHLQGDDATPFSATYGTRTPDQCWDLRGRLRKAVHG